MSKKKNLEPSPIEPQGKSSSKHGRKRIRETNTHQNIHPCCPVALWPAQSHPRTPPAKPGLNLIRIWTNKKFFKVPTQEILLQNTTEAHELKPWQKGHTLLH
jgi:hypothetical protein